MFLIRNILDASQKTFTSTISDFKYKKTELFTCKESKNHKISFGFDFQKYGNHKNMKQYTKYECINSYLSYVIYFLPFVVATLSGILPKNCVQIRDIMKMQKIYDI